jgi:hypothetical protein
MPRFLPRTPIPHCLSNILCTVSGCVISWAVGYSQGSVSRRSLANLLHLQARAHGQSAGEIEVPGGGPQGED